MSESIPKKRTDGLLTIELGPTLKTQWTQWCKERDVLPGRTIKTLVDKALAQGLELDPTGTGAVVKVRVLQSADTRPKVGREIYFTPSEDEAIQAVAKGQGFGFHEWVIAAVRGALANAPSYGQVELEVLTQSNMRMAQVVADLVELGRNSKDARQSEQFKALENQVKAHVEQVSRTMAQGARRWALKV
jgi:hypothetical protein